MRSPKSSSSVSRAGELAAVPALLTRTSIVPNASMAAATSVRRCSSEVTSPGTARIPLDCRATSESSAWRRAVMTTRAPAAASTGAHRAPRPDDAPVTMTTFPSRLNSSPGVRITVALPVGSCGLC